jgi:hypothetical protein
VGGPRDTGLALNLAPYESRVVVFSSQASKGRTSDAGLARAVKKSIDLSSDWTVTRSGVAEKKHEFHSWTGDPKWKQFSGQAMFEKAMTLKPSGRPTFLTFGEGIPVAVGSEKRAGSRMRAWLESPVREAAVVFVNGKRAGGVWCPPYEVDVTGLIRAGENSIRIVVGNLAVNAMVGRLDDYSKLDVRYGERFQAQDMEQIKPEPSGLLGPVRLVTR